MTAVPVLPAGFTAQPAWGFRDPSGDVSYELVRVYGAARFLAHRPGIEGQVLDELMSYWVATAVTDRGGAGETVHERSITYAQARWLKGARLTFATFSSIEDMRDRLPDMLDMRSRPAAEHARRPTTTMDVAAVPAPVVLPR